MKKWLVISALAVGLVPSTASADWLFTPNIGAGFGGAASGREHMTWGTSLGWMGEGIMGWEVDLSYTPEFFEADDDDLDPIENDNVTSFMGNVLLGVPIGGQLGPGFRPYVSGGAGLMQYAVQGSDDLFDVDSNEFGVNIGAGAMGFATDHVGFRGDLRYFRALTDLEAEDTFVDFADFDFWRASGGITFRW
jgi:hypothetical protein